MTRPTVVFLCTGNSCRSQMAEGWARHLRAESIDAHSAGTDPHGMNPDAVRVMAEAGVDIAKQPSETLDDLRSRLARERGAAPEDVTFDWIVTVCDRAHESCPLPPPGTRVLHVGFEDPPALAAGATTEDERLAPYRRVRDEIRAFVETLPAALGDVARRVVGASPCAACGYDLQGLDLEGACPECGAPVRRSVFAAQLREAAPWWLTRVARGVTIVIVAIALAVVLNVTISIGGILESRWSGAGMLVMRQLLPALAVASALRVFGAWLMTDPEPGRVEAPTSARRVARIGLVAGTVIATLVTFNDVWSIVSTEVLSYVLARVVVLAAEVVAIVGLVALAVHLGSLARRLPDERLARRGGRALIALAVTKAVATIPWSILVFVPMQSPDALNVMAWIIAPFQAAATVLVVVVAVYAIRFRRRLLVAARDGAARRAAPSGVSTRPMP